MKELFHCSGRRECAARVLHKHRARLQARARLPPYRESQSHAGGSPGPGASLSFKIHKLGANLNADYERLLEK